MWVVGSNAPICVVPFEIARAVPFDPVTFEIEATLGLVEDHSTAPVRSPCDPSLNVPVTVNACVEPTATLTSAGAIVIPVSVAGVTVNQAVPVTRPVGSVAVMSALPGAIADARPSDPGALEIDTEAEDDVHVTLAVRPLVLRDRLASV